MKRLTRNHIVAFALALGATALAHAQAPALQVAQDGTISATLQTPPGPAPFNITLFFDNSGGLTLNNPQDRFGGTTLFNSSSQVGTTITVVPNTPIGGQNLSTFPGGTAILLSANDGSQVPSTTGDIGKDIRVNANAQVSFGSNNTATVTFLTGGGGHFTVGLTNIIGAGAGGGGCRT